MNKKDQKEVTIRGGKTRTIGGGEIEVHGETVEVQPAREIVVQTQTRTIGGGEIEVQPSREIVVQPAREIKVETKTVAAGTYIPEKRSQ